MGAYGARSALSVLARRARRRAGGRARRVCWCRHLRANSIAPKGKCAHSSTDGSNGGRGGRARAGAALGPLCELNEDEMVEVRVAVRALAARLRGAARLRRRHLKRGRLDPANDPRQHVDRWASRSSDPLQRTSGRSRPRRSAVCDVSDRRARRRASCSSSSDVIERAQASAKPAASCSSTSSTRRPDGSGPRRSVMPLPTWCRRPGARDLPIAERSPISPIATATRSIRRTTLIGTW